ncbi:MAG: hypothetical protein U0521_25085 [Anaerolineae bacterium]
MTLPNVVRVPGLSGERFTVHYALSGVPTERDAAEKAADICIEQTVEFTRSAAAGRHPRPDRRADRVAGAGREQGIRCAHQLPG